MHEQWQYFNTDVDYVVPLAIHQVTREAVESETDLNTEVDHWLLTYTPTKLQEAQMADLVLRELHQWTANGKLGKCSMFIESPVLKRYWLSWPQMTARQGVLYYCWAIQPGSTLRVRPDKVSRDYLVILKNPLTARHALRPAASWNRHGLAQKRQRPLKG